MSIIRSHAIDLSSAPSHGWSAVLRPHTLVAVTLLVLLVLGLFGIGQVLRGGADYRDTADTMDLAQIAP